MIQCAILMSSNWRWVTEKRSCVQLCKGVMVNKW